MKKENRTSFLIILAVLMCYVLGGCSRITDNTDTDAPTAVGDQPHAEDYEQGYDLPVDSTQQEEAEEDLTEMMELIRAIYEDTEKGTSVNAVITQDTAVNMQKSIGEEGVPAAVSGSDVNMLNYEVMDHFLKEASEGQEAETVLYRIHTDGTVSREKFTFDPERSLLLTGRTCTRSIRKADGPTPWNQNAAQAATAGSMSGSIQRRDGSLMNTALHSRRSLQRSLMRMRW